MVVLILALVIAGLNISNEGINQLTGKERKAIASVNYGPKNLSLQWLGQEYTYPRERLHELSDILQVQLEGVPDYLSRIGRISSVLILDPVREKLQGP